MKSCDEDAVLNPCIEAKLQNDFRLSLPQLPEDVEDISIGGYLRKIHALVGSRGWSVAAEAWIGLFSFHKLAMYRDLEVNEERVAGHPIVRILAGLPAELPEERIPVETELDHQVPPESTYPILEADSSQLRAIEVAKTGRSLVLHGPPGTGKSQTIANLIAECIAADKKVLFVSEKMAALEVVYKRLAERGLQNYILELHSHKTNKRAVVAELDRSLREQPEHGESLSEVEFAQLRNQRHELNAYVSSLHRKRDPLQRTPYQVLGRLAELNRLEPLPFRLETESLLTPEALAQVLGLSRRLASVWHIAHDGPAFPWRGNRDDVYTPGSAHEYSAHISTIRSSAIRLIETLHALCGSLKLDVRIILANARLLTLVGDLLRSNPRPPQEWILKLPFSPWGAHPDYRHMLSEVSAWVAATSEEGPWVAAAREAVEHARQLEGFDLNRLMNLDLLELRARFGTRYRGLVRYLMADFYADRRQIRKCLLGDSVLSDIIQLLDLATRLRWLLDAFSTAVNWVRQLQEVFAEHQERITPDFACATSAGELFADGFEALAKDLDGFRASWLPFAEHFDEGWPKCNGEELEVVPLTSIVGLCEQFAQQLELLQDWIDYRDITAEWSQTPWHQILSGLEHNPPPAENIGPTVELTLLQAWWDLVIRKDKHLARFRAADHERMISDFRTVDERLWQKGQHRVIAAAQPRRPDPAEVHPGPGSETAVLANEVAKKRRHLPIRRLFAQIPNLLQQLKPIILMSPLSISQYLTSPNIRFDMVLFDEASQICPEDAVVALYRAKQAVVAGDRCQLPPTSFFQALTAADDGMEDESTVDEYESVLDALIGRGLPELRLKWHYRSKNEHLIAFSNREFYEDRLVTFPHAVNRKDQGVFFEYVPEGIYDRGGNRANYPEAEKVIEIALRHIREDPLRSVGIVAFSVSQADAIENVREKLKKDPYIEARIRHDRLEGFFIKNLEKVQGDERDVMIFSVGYGPDQSGRLTMNFGPLNRSGGERRLNVAITRAKQKVILVSSIKAGDISATEALAPGVRALKSYLDYAENGPRALYSGLPQSQGETESPFERVVAAAIREMGYDVVPQVGCSGYRIDLGVLEPGSPGRFILGVECDGAMYHSAATARDRDRLRQAVLEGLGWRIHRVWSTDWVNRPDAERARLRAAIQRALTNKESPPLARMPSSADNKGTPPETDAPPEGPVGHEDMAMPSWQTYYEVFMVDGVDCQGLEENYQAILDDWSPPLCTTAIAGMIQAEAPIHMDVITRRLAHLIGRRLGSRTRDALEQLVLSAIADSDIWLKDGFLYFGDTPPHRVRIPTEDPRSRRAPGHICIEEYCIAAASILRSAGGMEEDGLVSAVARVFGFRRTGPKVRKAILEALHRVERKGIIGRRSGRWIPVALRDRTPR